MAITYKDAGVDIDAGNRLVDRIRPLVAATRRPEVLDGLGGFAGLCSIPSGYVEPVLVSGTDGVGTKLKSAFATGRHDTVGIDLVAMSVNDVVVTGAQPLFFLDYFASGRLEVDVAAAVVAGIAEGCKRAGCALVGGETAELPGMYADGEYDLAGFCVGVAERELLRPMTTVQAGDSLIALPSSGLHSNGHSLARKAILEALDLDWAATPELLAGATVADALLEPTRIYAGALQSLGSGVTWKAAAHITGGGLIENAPRMLADDQLALSIDTDSWTVPGVFELIASAGVDQVEMRRTFNLGVGMVIVVDSSDLDRALELLSPHDAWTLGEVISRADDAVEFHQG